MATNGQAPPDFNPAAFFDHPAFKAATEAQKKFAQKTTEQMTAQWKQAVGSVSPDMLRDLGAQWTQATERMMAAWGEQTAPIAQQTAERATERAKTIAGVATGFAQAWQTMAKSLTAGTDPTEAATRFNESVRAQIETVTATAMEAANDLQTVAQRFFGEMQAAAPGTPWAAMTMPFDNLPDWAQAEGIEAGDVPIAALFEQMVGTFDRSFGRVLNSPGLGLTREFNEEIAQAIAAYQGYLREQARYQTLMGGLFTKSVERFTQALGKKAQDGEPVDGLRALTRLWTAEADAVFTDAFRTPAYIEQQNELVAATMRYRKQRRAVAELFQQMNDQPTRSEVDEAFKLLHGARKEIKALRREVAALKKQLGDAPATKPASAPKAASKTAPKPDDLTTISGIGTVRAKKLQQAGFATFADLAAATPAALTPVIGNRLFDDERLAEVIADAQALAA
ncbi:MAG: poly(R)-hydroxyalkanoic acid synthase subunit PhaE [Bacteroidota bacterium]